MLVPEAESKHGKQHLDDNKVENRAETCWKWIHVCWSGELGPNGEIDILEWSSELYEVALLWALLLT